LSFNPLKDLVPVANFGATGVAVIVTPSLPVKTLPEFVAYAKSRPGYCFTVRLAMVRPAT
jgi:tripartite-type tricarboxylate transporter receptor subunit TctC